MSAIMGFGSMVVNLFYSYTKSWVQFDLCSVIIRVINVLTIDKKEKFVSGMKQVSR